MDVASIALLIAKPEKSVYVQLARALPVLRLAPEEVLSNLPAVIPKLAEVAALEGSGPNWALWLAAVEAAGLVPATAAQALLEHEVGEAHAMHDVLSGFDREFGHSLELRRALSVQLGLPWDEAMKRPPIARPKRKRTPGFVLKPSRTKTAHLFAPARSRGPDCPTCGRAHRVWFSLDLASVPQLAAQLPGWSTFNATACLDCDASEQLESMAIYTSFIVSSYRAFDEARKKARRTGKDVLELLGDANVDLDWNDSFAEAFLKYLVGRTVEDEQDREAFMVEPIEAPGYVLFPLPEQLVEALAGWSEKKRAATVKAYERAGFAKAHEALAALEPLAKRASTEGKNLYLCIHIP